MRRTILLEAPCLCCQDKQALLCQTLTQELVSTTGMPILFSITVTCNNTVQLHQLFHTHIHVNIAPFRLCNLHIAVPWFSHQPCSAS